MSTGDARAAGGPGARLLSALPWLVLLFIVGVDVASSRIVVSGAYPTAAVVASTMASVRRTRTVAVVAVALAGLAWLWNDHVGPVDSWARFALAGALGAIAIFSAAVRVRREHDLEVMTVVAETVQRAVLRTIPRQVGSVGFAARYLSASRAALVGGDLFEVEQTRHGVRVIVGDVRGKGLEAVQLAATVLAAFRRAAFEQPQLGAVAIELDKVVRAVAGEEDFVTAIFVEYKPDGSITLVNCGHHAPLLLSSPSALVDTGDPQPPLGLGVTGGSVTLSWGPQERLLLYTDGLVEARDRTGAFFPLEEHAPVLSAGSLDGALDELLTRLQAFAAHQVGDDIALLLSENLDSTAAAGRPRLLRRSRTTRTGGGSEAPG